MSTMRKSEWLSLTQKERDDYWSLLTEKEKASFDLDRYLKGKPKSAEPIPDACISPPDILAQIREKSCYRDFRAAIQVFSVFFIGAGFTAIIGGIGVIAFLSVGMRDSGLSLIGSGIAFLVLAYPARWLMAAVADIADLALEKESAFRRSKIIEKVK